MEKLYTELDDRINGKLDGNLMVVSWKFNENLMAIRWQFDGYLMAH